MDTTPLLVVGFASPRDFGPFSGFTKACPVATLIVDRLNAGYSSRAL